MLLPERQLTLAVTGLRLALFLSVLNQTILAIAMPRIVTDLGTFGYRHSDSQERL